MENGEETLLKPLQGSGSPKRIEWIDCARCIATFLVVYAHWRWRLGLPESNGHGLLHSYAYFSTLFGNVPFFLVLTGYFLGRNITWGKAWRRFVWLLIPFILLNLAMYGAGLATGTLPPKGICSIFGLGHLFTLGGPALDSAATVPVIVPSWFLRDVMLLSLAAPLLAKIKPIVMCAVCFAFSCLAFQVPLAPTCVLNPGTCMFFAIGVCLSNFSLEGCSRWVTRGRTLFFALLFVAASVYSLYSVGCLRHGAEATLFGMLAGACMIGYAGMAIERYLPHVSKRMAACAPACFFIYMMHHPILTLIHAKGPQELVHSVPALFLPVPVFFALLFLFFAIRRLCPWLLPYVALVKYKRPTT